MDSQDQDVNQAAAAADSSDSNQASATDTTEQQDTATPLDEAKAVPYERFAEVNSKYRETQGKVQTLEQRLAQVEGRFAPQQTQPDPQLQVVKQQLKELGFVSKEDMDAQIRQREDDARIGQQITQLEKEWDGKDGRPAFNRQDVIEFALKRGIPDPEIAFKALRDKEITDWKIQQAIAKSRGVKSEASDGSGSTNAGTTDGDLKEAIAAGDKTALRTFLKRVSQPRG